MCPFEGMLRVRKHNPRAFSSVGIVVRFRFFFRERVLIMRDSYRTTSSAASDAASARFISVYCDASFIFDVCVYFFPSLYSVSDRFLNFFTLERNSERNRASRVEPLTVFRVFDLSSYSHSPQKTTNLSSNKNDTLRTKKGDVCDTT